MRYVQKKHSSHQSALQDFEKIEQSETEALEKACGMDHALHINNFICRAASEYIKACAENLCAFAPNDTKSSNIFGFYNNTLADHYSRLLLDYLEILEGFPHCRSIDDTIDLQSKSMQQIADNYCNIANSLTRAFFDYWSWTATSHLAKCSPNS